MSGFIKESRKALKYASPPSTCRRKQFLVRACLFIEQLFKNVHF